MNSPKRSFHRNYPTLFAFAFLILVATGCSTPAEPRPQITGDTEILSLAAFTRPDPLALPASLPEAAPAVLPETTPEALPLLAQDEEEEKKVWDGLVELGASATGGNSKTRDFDARFLLKAEWEKDRCQGYARHEWGEAEDSDGETERNRNRQTAGAKYERDLADRFFGFAKQDFERDEFQELKMRSTTTVGAGYRILDEEKHKLGVEVGVGWESNNFYEDDNSRYSVFRFGEDWDWDFTTDWELVQTFEYLTSIPDYDDDFRTVTTVDLRHQMSANLFLSFGFEHRYYAEPARLDPVLWDNGMYVWDNGKYASRQDWLATIKLGWSF